MNFFQTQAQARSQSRRLVVLFLLAVGLIVAAVNLVLIVAYAVLSKPDRATLDAGSLLEQSPGVAIVATLITVGIIAAASFYKMTKLRAGGSVVARGLGATLLPAQTQDVKYRRLRNVIEEIAIASGVPVPQIFILEQEQAINAFAAGYSPADAAVTVTRGALDKLSRDELQGVIAHEFSHVVNGDMRLSIRLMGVIFGILAIATVARMVLRGMSRGRGSRKGGAGVVLLAAFAIMAIGYIGVFFGRLIKAGFSRERETLADASAVQFTRQTQGLAGALKKIAGLTSGSKLANVDGEEVSHMLFADGTGFSRMFATHPPLAERIRRLEPTFDPKQIQEVARNWNSPDFVPEDLAPAIAGFAPGASVAAPASTSGLIGSPGPQHFHYAEALRAGIPAELRDIAHDPARAPGLLLALLLENDGDTRKRQLSLLDAGARVTVTELHAKLAGLDAALRLPLAETAFPALRQRPREEMMALVATISRLTHADGSISLFEFCLGRMVRTLVADALRPAKVAVAGHLKLPQCEADVTTLLSALAQQGGDAAAADRAYRAGLSRVLPQSKVRYQQNLNAPAVLDGALRTLDRMNGPSKEMLLEALVTTVSHDGRITLAEAELVRAVCTALHCPLPPLLAG